MKASRPISPIFSPKIGCHGDRKKRAKSLSTIKCLPYGENLVKTGPVNPAIICLF